MIEGEGLVERRAGVVSATRTLYKIKTNPFRFYMPIKVNRMRGQRLKSHDFKEVVLRVVSQILRSAAMEFRYCSANFSADKHQQS